MKKFINKITALIITLVLSVGFFSGCDLITTDTEADMSLTIATIQLEGMNKEDIKKRQMVSAYNTTGYLYVYYYGYTTKQAYEKILEDLVNNRIIVQQSKQALTTATTALRNNKGYFLLASEAEDKTSIENALTLKNYKGNDFTTVDKNDSVDNF
ncbi:MAG: hypothetical protein J6Q38_03580, partial [Clostridia bacterium]|nr:hypothetical protein [Clostridia bacterium]